MFDLCLCWVVLCRWRPCDRLIPYPRSPAIYHNSDQETVKFALASEGVIGHILTF
jgi:hypothetical protein